MRKNLENRGSLQAILYKTQMIFQGFKQYIIDTFLNKFPWKNFK